MVTGAKIGYGTTLTWGTAPADVVVELTRIGAVALSATKVDATTLTSPDFYREILPGLIDPGDVAIEGLFRPDNPGQIALLNDMNSRISRAFKISFPTSLSGTTWTGTAYITGFVAGDATPEGIIPFSATLSIIGKPTLNVTASAGMTAMTGKEEIDEANLVILPAVGVAVYTYVANPVAALSTWIKLTITAAVPQTIEVTVLGVVHVLTTEIPYATPMLIDAVGKVTPVYIEIKAADKSPKNYTLYVPRLAA